MPDTLCIIGLGSAGQRHARNALEMGCEVIGYDTRTFGRAFDFGDGPISLVDSVESGLSTKPLGVIVATPPDTHAAILRRVIEARVPVLCEKPLTTTARDAEDIAKRYEYQTGVPLAVGYQLRYGSHLGSLKARVDRGDFGMIYAAHAEFASQKWCSYTYQADFLLECSHELDLLRWFLGDPKRALYAGTWLDGFHSGWIDFAGARATFHFDGLHPGYRRSLTLYGTQGVGEWRFDPGENEEAYRAELRDFLAACRGEQAPACTGRDGWWALRLVEAMRKSGESRRWETC